MLDKIRAAWAVFHRGEAVADPAAWKSGGMQAVTIAAFLTAILDLLKALGHEITIDQATINGVAVGVISVVHVVFTVITSDKVGLRAKPDDAEPVPAPVIGVIHPGGAVSYHEQPAVVSEPDTGSVDTGPTGPAEAGDLIRDQAVDAGMPAGATVEPVPAIQPAVVQPESAPAHQIRNTPSDDTYFG
jgi:hypothetical protein